MKLTTVLYQNRHLATAILLTGTLAVGGFVKTVRTDAQTAPKVQTQTVTRNAVWNPKDNTVQSIHQSCANQGTKFANCFVNEMQQAGASNQAIAFTRSINNMGYVQAFRPVGKVSIAAVTMPFRANENQAIYLVNGKPGRINVDDNSLLQRNELKTNPVYTKLTQKYTDILVFPGDRTPNAVKTQRLANQGERFIVNYKLNDRCYACSQVGTAQFAFDFDSTGRFLGTKLMNVTTAQNQR